MIAVYYEKHQPSIHIKNVKSKLSWKLAATTQESIIILFSVIFWLNERKIAKKKYYNFICKNSKAMLYMK